MTVESGGGINRVCVVGLGLIGGSAAMSLRRGRRVAAVTGVDPDPGARSLAMEMGACDAVTPSLEEGLEGADVVLLAVPMALLEEVGRLAAGRLKPGAVITDVGSVKAGITAAMKSATPPGVHFVGGHPMTGSERAGIANADPYLFENAVWVLTPDGDTPGWAVQKASRLASLTGAQVVRMSPEAHDIAVSGVSHLPQLVAVSLMKTLTGLSERQPELLGLAAGGLRDTTRIAESPPGMWIPILLANRRAVLDVAERFANDLRELVQLIRDGNGEALCQEFQLARETRRRLPQTAKGLLPRVYEVVLVAEDRPGIIGIIGTSLGEAGVNIADIEIMRQREGEGGTIRLGFTSEEGRERAVSILQELGFVVHRR